jgi:large subunit ribosomal protein L4
MSKVSIYNSKGKEIGKFALGDDLVKKRVNTKVLYQVVNNYLASRHRGTHKTKGRGEVRGGGKKPWRQKGTGRARTRSIRNPIWRGGGIIFGPEVRSYSYSVPVKAKRLALFEAIKSKVQTENFVVFDNISLEKPKTKNMASVIKSMKLGKKCLVVMEKVEDNVKLASRNIPYFSVKNRKDINALDVCTHNKLAVSEDALNNLIKRLK